MKYEFKVNLIHNYYSEEELTVTVEGIADEKEAESEAHRLAQGSPSRWDVEHTDTEIDHIELLISAEPEEGEEPPVIRCDRTMNMDFNLSI